MQFIRFITHESCHAFYNMALDEALSESVRQKISPPTLRLYSWKRPSVSIGFFQKISDIDLSYCENKEYPVVRRLTGGRAVLHDSELTYSFSSSNDSSIFKGSLLENYTVISNALVHALNLSGIKAEASFAKKRTNGHRSPACFKTVSFGEITSGRKKVIGSAQRRYADGFLQHGSMIFDFNSHELCSVLKGGNVSQFSEIGSLKSICSEISIRSLTLYLKEAFEKELAVKLITDGPTKEELARAKELEKTKYSSKDWNYKR